LVEQRDSMPFANYKQLASAKLGLTMWDNKGMAQDLDACQ